MVINIVIIILFLIFSLYVFKESKEYFIFFILMWFVHFWMMISVAYLEKGVNIKAHMITYQNGSTIRLAIYEVIFFLSALLTIKVMHRKNETNFRKKTIEFNNEDRKDKFWLIIIASCTLILLFDALISPNKITNSKVTRFNFYLDFSKLSFITYYISLFINYLFCVNGIILLNSIKNKRYKLRNMSILLLLIAIIYEYLIDVEFMGYIYLIIIFMTPILMNLSLEKYKFLTVKNLLIVTTVVMIALIPKLLFFSKSTVYKGVADSTLDKFIYRSLALQGEVWWGTDNLCQKRSSSDIHQMKNEMNALINDENRFNAGIWYLSYLIIPKYNHTASLATLNCGHPAILIAIFGYLGAVIAQCICGIIFAIFTVILKRKIERKQYASVFFAYAIWYMTYTAFYMGGIWYFGGNTMKLSIIGLVLCGFYNRLVNYKKKNNLHIDESCQFTEKITYKDI